jgi:hypothetical protein
MHRRVAYHATPANRFRPGLELRFHQRHQHCPRLGQSESRRQHRGEADKARVASNDIDRLGDFHCGQVTRVDALVNDDASVLPQLPGKLSAPDIDGMDPRCATGQQHIGKATGRGTDIERDEAGNIDGEMVERVREFDPAARHPGVIAAAYRERGLIGDCLTGFLDTPLARIDETREDQRLRALAAFGEAAIDEKLVGAALDQAKAFVKP